MRVVLDTNILISSISLNSPYHKIISALTNKDYTLVLTNEILLEYTEKLEEKFGMKMAEAFFEAAESLSNIVFIERIFESRLIETDLDDNKFVDCAYAGNVNFLVTNDKHFDRIKSIEFPKLIVLTIDEFLDVLK